MNLQASIITHLRRIDEPCTVQDIAHAIGMLEPGEGVPDAVRSNLTAMVRNLQVKRHHNGDGVLRYSLGLGFPAAEAASLSKPAVKEPEPSAPPHAQPTRHRYQTGVSERVLAAFEHSGVPLARSTLERRIYPPLTATQVLSALVALRKKGLVQRVGTTAAARWVRVDALNPAAAAARATAEQEAIKGLASDLGIAAAHSCLLRARLAIDAALQALEA